MSERYGSYPPDEPIIGADTPPPPGVQPLPGIVPPAGASSDDDEPEWDDEEYDEEWGYDDEDGYYGEPPVRQPMFYVFLALAGVVLIVLVFLLFSFLKGDNSKTAATGFNVQIDSPVPNQTIVVGRDQDVVVKARATEPITRIQLYLNDRLVDETDPTEVPADGIYTATFRLQLPSKGDYSLYVRVSAASGATKDSPKVKIHAVEEVGDRPVSINGKVITPASARTAPRDDADEVRRLNAGETVKILGKTRDGEWLLVDIGGPEPRWVKRNAIQEQDSLALVPVREPTPVPQPSASATPSATASPSATGTPNSPDFAPTNAVLVDGGARLRVTIVNLASSGYSGLLVVGVTGISVDPNKQAFNVSIPANGSSTVDFVLSGSISGQASVRVSVDPDLAIKETNRDNNVATFVVQPAAEAPNLVITGATVSGTQVAITVNNTGGELKSTSVTVRITFGTPAATLDQPQTMALAKGQTITISVPKPSAGQATAQLFIGGQQASAPFPFTVN